MYREAYPISVLCETLEVSVSGYYAWKKRSMSQHQQDDNQLAQRIQVVSVANREVYGSPRLSVELKEQAMHCSRRRVARLMREMG
jgi:putative transposase